MKLLVKIVIMLLTLSPKFGGISFGIWLMIHIYKYKYWQLIQDVLNVHESEQHRRKFNLSHAF
jgi:hypothetical protein